MTNGRHFGSQQYTAHVSNSEVCSKTGQPTITTLIKQSGQCGHVARADQLKITTVHCEHLSTHLVTGDGREDSLVRPGYELSVMISKRLNLGQHRVVHGLGWPMGWVKIFQFLVGWVGSTTTKVLTIWKDYVNACIYSRSDRYRSEEVIRSNKVIMLANDADLEVLDTCVRKFL